jgi:hypothetical protein
MSLSGQVPGQLVEAYELPAQSPAPIIRALTFFYQDIGHLPQKVISDYSGKQSH